MKHLSSVSLGTTAVFIALLMPGYQALQSWYHGALVHARKTRAITEAVLLYLVICGIALVIGSHWDGMPGIHFALAAFVLGGVAQTSWLAWRSRGIIRELEGEV